jgi:hypothetical protein
MRELEHKKGGELLLESIGYIKGKPIPHVWKEIGTEIDVGHVTEYKRHAAKSS